MADPRIDKWAQVLVQYSLAVKVGDKVALSAPDSAAPLVIACYRELLRAGAHVYPRLTIDGMRETLLREASDKQLQFISELDRFEVEFFDAELTIFADLNTKALTNIDPARAAMRRAARQPLQKREDDRVTAGEYKWVLTMYPTHAHAMDANMSLSEFEAFVYDACLLNEADPVAAWQALGAQQQRYADYLNGKDTIRIVTPDTDIRYRVGGRKWVNCDGRLNFPDGEVFSAPLEDSVNGHVRFTYPAIYDGNEVEDVRLTFRDGVVVEATAGKGLDFLNAMLDMDGGSRRLGEVAFGTNYGIQHFTRELLFDEKIGGTMHMALGASYGESGGVNESGLHWDMLCDLRQGQAWADGELFYENGKFVI